MANIFLVDDDVHVIQSLTTVLESADHKVTSSGSIAEFNAVDDPTSKFDLILLDLWLVDGSGLSILESLKGDHPDFPVIVISGGGQGKTLEQAVAFADAKGADQVLIKPFRNRELFRAIDEVLAKGS